MADVNIIIVAAGSGTRFGAPLPKQFCPLAGRPVLMHTIDALRRACPEASLILVISEEMQSLWDEQCAAHDFASPRTVYGGSTRWESVRNALSAVDSDASVIMVHDGARPFPSAAMLDELTAALSDAEVAGAVPAVPVTDSLRRMHADGITSEAVDRAPLRAVQTPQAFRADILRRAYELPWSPQFTDDASVVEAAALGRIAITGGSPTNIKITNPLDISIAEALLSNMPQ